MINFGLGIDSKYNNRIVSFAKDKNPNFIWIGTWGGLVKYNVQAFTYSLYSNNQLDQNSLSDNKISTLLSDKFNNLWVGTQEKGIKMQFFIYL